MVRQIVDANDLPSTYMYRKLLDVDVDDDDVDSQHCLTRPTLL
jgi:hypothetical protein